MEQTPTPDVDPDEPFPAALVIARSAAIGAAIVFALITAICLGAGRDLVEPIAIAAMPAIFGGPLIAGLFAIGEYHQYEARHGHA